MRDDKSTPAQEDDASVRWGKDARDQLGLDDRILVLLELHLATFAIGVAALAISLARTYLGKLA